MNNYYEIFIRTDSGWFDINWKGLVQYRDLLVLLIKRNFVSRYQQTFLGPAWIVLQPLLTTVVFTAIFVHVARISTDRQPPVLFYLCGLLPWTYFAQTVSSTARSLIDHAPLFRKVYFPRLIVPLSLTLSNLGVFAIQLLNFLAFYVYFRCFLFFKSDVQANEVIFLLPLLLLEMAALSLGIGLWIASLTVKYRDFQNLIGFAIQLWMYATPVIYPVSMIPGKWRFLTVVNPMTPIVEAYRHVFFGVGSFEMHPLLISAGMTVFILVTGLLVFARIERTLVDTL